MKKLAILGMVVMSIGVFGGCQLFEKAEQNDEAARETVREAWINMQNVESSSFTAEMDIDVEATTDEETENVKLMIEASGVEDYRNSENPMVSFKLGLEVESSDYTGYLGDISMAMDMEMLYVMLANLSDFDGQLPVELSSQFTDKWWNFPLPPEANLGFAMVKDESEMTEEEKELKRLVEEAEFMKNYKSLGDGHYSAEFDPEGLEDYMNKVLELAVGNTQEMTE